MRRARAAVRRLALSLTAAAAAVLLIPCAASAASFPVETLDDSGPGSLRQAILDANGATGSDLIVFDEELGGEIELQSELPWLTDEVEIQGPGADLVTVRRDSGNYRILTVMANATISGLSLANGAAATLGGGIHIWSGTTTTLEDVAVTGSTAGTEGGGIFSEGALIIRRSEIADNESSGNGAGIYHIGAGQVTIEDSTLSGNTSHATGPSAGGGGIVNGGSSSGMTVRNSTISGNSVAGDLRGAGILQSANSPVVVANSTIGGNQAGSGVGPGTNLARISLGQIELTSTIVSDPLGGGANCSPELVSHGFNLASDDSCSLGELTDQPSTDPELGPLTDNGGPTETMAPSPTSPALDQGSAGSADADQRGESRPFDLSGIDDADDGADVGAVELQASEIPPLELSITGGPEGPTNQVQPTFTFTVQDPITVECSLDAGIPDFGPCSEAGSHSASGGLDDGEWTFRVRATNALGEVTRTRGFTVDTVAPQATITFPASNGHTFPFGAGASFSFTSSEASSSFQCALDGAALTPCESPAIYSGLASGSHQFRVHATDEAGNTGPPANRSFTVAPAGPSQACLDAEAELGAATAALANARAKVKAAKAKVKKAKKKLRKAKASGNAAKVKKAKKRLKKAKANLKRAKSKLATAKSRHEAAQAAVAEHCA